MSHAQFCGTLWQKVLICGKMWYIYWDYPQKHAASREGDLNFVGWYWEDNAVFRGINGVNIDAKGRMVMPSRYRERLQLDNQNDVIITIDTEEKCLLLYPTREWEEIEKKIAALPSFNPVARRIQRLLIGHATDVEMDSQGRILLPPMLRDYATLKRRAVIVGQGKKFEIWDEGHWEKCREQWLAEEADLDPEALPEEVKSISL